jgi:hypothetical protein
MKVPFESGNQVWGQFIGLSPMDVITMLLGTDFNCNFQSKSTNNDFYKSK